VVLPDPFRGMGVGMELSIGNRWRVLYFTLIEYSNIDLSQTHAGMA